MQLASCKTLGRMLSQLHKLACSTKRSCSGLAAEITDYISSLPTLVPLSLLAMPSVREILEAFRAAGTSDAAIDAIASLELSADDLLDLNPAEVWGVVDEDAERIAGAIAAFNNPPRVPQPPGPPPGALPPMPSAPPPTPPATGARCLVVAGPPGAGGLRSACSWRVKAGAREAPANLRPWPTARRRCLNARHW